MLRAPNGRLAKGLAEVVFAHQRQFAEVSVEGHRREIGVDRYRRATVPGADVLADITAKDVLAEVFAQLYRGRLARLDGVVRNAEAGVELPTAFVGNDGGGGAGVDAARATAAAVGGFRGDRFDGSRSEDLAQEEPAPRPLVNKASILANPAQAGALGDLSFEHGRRVDTHPIVMPGRQFANQLIEALA